MASAAKIAVIIPCFRVKSQLSEVIASIPDFVDHILLVDDCCPEQSVRSVAVSIADPRVRTVFHETNLGVGGACITGYEEALRLGATILVKMDGDGQMDAKYLPRLVQPIIVGKADFTKGNRFFDLVALRSMPLSRKVGNMGLSILTKAASGYWGIADPTNGYTAIHAEAYKLLARDSLARRYFFETSMLIQLNIVKAVVMDVPIPARYGDEVSSLNIWRVFFSFPPRLIQGLFRRIVWRYFVYDMTAVTLFLVSGTSLLLFGVSFGIYHWLLGHIQSQFQSAGTVALALLPTLLGCQLLLQAMLLDVMDRPTSPIQNNIDDTPPTSPCANFR